MSPRVDALIGGLDALRRDVRGVSAVEFALVAPLLISVYMGMAELSQGMTAQRRVSHAASAIGDLVAQDDKVVNTEMADIFAAATTIMTPYPTTTLKLRVTSITGDATGAPKVDWSDAPSGQSGLTALTVGAAVPICATSTSNGCLPTGLIAAAGDTVILAEATYTYNSLAKYIVKNGMNYTEKFYLRPRKTDKVVRAAT